MRLDDRKVVYASNHNLNQFRKNGLQRHSVTPRKTGVLSRAKKSRFCYVITNLFVRYVLTVSGDANCKALITSIPLRHPTHHHFKTTLQVTLEPQKRGVSRKLCLDNAIKWVTNPTSAILLENQNIQWCTLAMDAT